MKRPGMLRIEYTGEQPKKYLSDGKTLWVYDKELGQLEKFKVSEDSIPKEALELLKGFANMDEIFTVEDWAPKKTVKGHTYLRLSPKSKNANYKMLECDFGEGNLLNVMTIYNKSGNISTYAFKNIRVNKGLNDALFKWRN
jgi:chaperone LolA